MAGRDGRRVVPGRGLAPVRTKPHRHREPGTVFHRGLVVAQDLQARPIRRLQPLNERVERPALMMAEGVGLRRAVAAEQAVLNHV
ncbi:hypothetical protein GCM10011415_02490 [Salipiger pallidus]|uniref:Uncharacterized protein n=1 Tax=Salipiger pallidus TaxID=1775170 RepID=A0A8J2ZGJ2_9RHOB|nr:hypothetical protein GCM10011415_02490 [Salipiger pallidus]